MIILKLPPMLSKNQFMEKDSKYQLLNKCFKDNTSENLLNENRQTIFLVSSKTNY